MNNPMKKNEFAVVLASDNRGILPLSVTVFSLLNTAGPETFYKIYAVSYTHLTLPTTERV